MVLLQGVVAEHPEGHVLIAQLLHVARGDAVVIVPLVDDRIRLRHRRAVAVRDLPQRLQPLEDFHACSAFVAQVPLDLFEGFADRELEAFFFDSDVDGS